MSAVTIPPPRRWDEPFDLQMGDREVGWVLDLPPFAGIDSGGFPPSTPLRSILKNDAAIRRFQDGDIIVRQGDYGNSAFVVLSGYVRAILDRGLPDHMLGRRAIRRKGIFSALSQLWANHDLPEIRDVGLYPSVAGIGSRDEEAAGQQRVFLQDVPAVVSQCRTGRMGSGEIFGELSAIGRVARTATVFADGAADLLEIRWQGLRDILRWSNSLREECYRLYRERSLASHLRSTPLFRHLNDSELQSVADHVEFRTYGDFDWYGSYKQLAKESSAQRLAGEPLIVEEGHYVDGLLLILSGFARMSVRVGRGHHTLGYLGRGGTFGLEELAHNWQQSANLAMQRSLRAIGHTDVLLVPTAVVEQYVLRTYPPAKLPPLPDTTFSIRRGSERPAGVDQDILEFLVEERFINGTATMMIDIDRCTRCDDCVRACAAAHDNNPRFIRHGRIVDHYMVANACMHCTDPVCMIGCPTGAIHRGPAEGQVIINDLTCIGCATCANSCPYQNIRMVQVRDQQGTQILNEATFNPILKATKCDLCIDQPKGVAPACERACPHDAMKRIDMRNLDELAAWMNR